MPCIEESLIVAMLRGELSSREVEEIDDHVDGCESCRDLVATLAQSSWLAPSPKSGAAALEVTAGVSSPRAEELARGEEIGRYVVLGPVAAGGMGIVYAAYDPELDRKIAIKLLRTDISDSAGTAQSWILREAQSLARLSHPNVVAVYDVGTFRDMVFVAMEFLTGETLDEWLHRRPRSWREIVAAFVAAGRGLAAAHDAGLVHRDFKPRNVVVEEGGQVKVVDFGLARPAELTPVATSAGEEHPPRLAALGRTRSIAGTPAYMAPEQHAGGDADPRSDQFSYCLAMSEALFGQRPFPGDTEEELRTAKEKGLLREPPSSSKVPSWLRRLLERGLCAAPADRFPSMHELLAELSRDHGARMRRLAWAVAVSLLLGGSIAVTWLSGDNSQLCRGGERKLAGVWDDARRHAVRAAFLATGQPFAPAAFRSTARQLDAYAAGWVRDHTRACEATRVRGELSEKILDLRMGCLDRRLRELRALTRLLARADAKVVSKATAAAHALRPAAACLHNEPLRLRTPPPTDARKRVAIEKARDALADATALHHAGKYRSALKVVREVVRGLPALGYKPLVAEAMLLWGELEEAGGDARVAERKFYEAFWAAQASRSDRVAAKAAIGLIQILGYWLDRVTRAEHWARHAAAAIERLGEAPALEADYLSTLGGLYYTKGKYREALQKLRRTLELRQRVLGLEHPETALSLNDVGLTLWMLGRLDESMRYLRRSLALGERLNGPRHPDVAVTLNNLALVLHARGSYREALPLFERSIAIRKQVMGPRHVNVATALGNAARTLHALGRFDESLAMHRRALAIREKARGPGSLEPALSLHNIGSVLASQHRYTEALDVLQRALALRRKHRRRDHPETAYTLSRVSDVLLHLGRIDAAEAAARDALRIAEKELGKSHANLPGFLTVWGRVLAARGRLEEAAAQHRRALRIATRKLRPDHPQAVISLTELGHVQLRLGKAAAAVQSLTRAVRAATQREGDPIRLAHARFELARALAASRTGARKAKREARAALAAYRRAGRWFRQSARRVASWMARELPGAAR